MTSPLHHDLDYFLEMYHDDEDPWGFDTSWYERRKYALTLASLPHPHYRRGLEPGCSNGALTELLAPKCDELIAFDLVTEVVERARARLAPQASVSVEQKVFPTWMPQGTGDLIVWSEVAYYLTDTGLELALTQVESWLDPGGVLVAVHYTGDTDYPQTANSVHGAIGEAPFLRHLSEIRDVGFRIDVWDRR